jgi:hypothetical protein
MWSSKGLTPENISAQVEHSERAPRSTGFLLVVAIYLHTDQEA